MMTVNAVIHLTFYFCYFVPFKTVWTNDSGNKITEKDRGTCNGCCIQGSGFKEYLERGPAAAVSGTPGCGQEEEEATEKSWFVQLLISV